MSDPYLPEPQTVRISAGTAIKIGFFGAFGALLFSLIVSAILGVIGLILTLIGVGLFQNLYNG